MEGDAKNVVDVVNSREETGAEFDTSLQMQKRRLTGLLTGMSIHIKLCKI
jgi:hypothetical protein